MAKDSLIASSHALTRSGGQCSRISSVRSGFSSLVGVDELRWGASLAHDLKPISRNCYRRHGDGFGGVKIKERWIVGPQSRPNFCGSIDANPQ